MKLLRNYSVLIGLLCAAVALIALGFVNRDSKLNAADFVRHTYAKLYHHNSTLSSLDKAAEIFSSPLLELIRKEQQNQIESGEIGKLSSDPLCNCQDATSVQIVEITSKVAEQDHATVLVALSVSGLIERLRLNLVQEAHRWKIDDVTGDQIPSLRKSLIEN